MKGISSSIDYMLPTFHRTLNIGRGGALNIVEASSSTVPIGKLIGGNISKSPIVMEGSKSILGVDITPEGRAVLSMAIAMSLHYLGYSLARPSTLSLFTSSKTGFSKSSAFPLAMAFVSPMSLLLLMGYGKELDANGPRIALRHTTVYCATILSLSAFLIQKFDNNGASFQLLSSPNIPIVKIIVGVLFVFRESYVQLLTSQMWSFMASVLTPAQSATWFAPISGLTSVTSALAGLWVSNLTTKIGLTGVLAGAGLSLVCSVLLTENAYSISEKVCTFIK